MVYVSVVPTLSQRARKDGAPGYSCGERILLTDRSSVSSTFVERQWHIGVASTNVNDGAVDVCGSHLSQKTRKMGHPRSIWCGRNHNQCQGQRTGVSVPHGQRQRQLQDRSCGRLWFPPFAKDAKDGAPSFDWVRSKSKSKSQATDRSVRSTGARSGAAG